VPELQKYLKGKKHINNQCKNLKVDDHSIVCLLLAAIFVTKTKPIWPCVLHLSDAKIRILAAFIHASGIKRLSKTLCVATAQGFFQLCSFLQRLNTISFKGKTQ